MKCCCFCFDELNKIDDITEHHINGSNKGSKKYAHYNCHRVFHIYSNKHNIVFINKITKLEKEIKLLKKNTKD